MQGGPGHYLEIVQAKHVCNYFGGGETSIKVDQLTKQKGQ